MAEASYFPGFDYPASDLLKFIAAAEFFTIMLKNGEIVHFATADPTEFQDWLLQNNVKDIRKEGIL